MSFYRTHRAQYLRSDNCRSNDLATCDTFRRLGVNQPVYVQLATAPSSPDSLSVSFNGTDAIISFLEGFNGGTNITNYQYSINDGVSYTDFSPAVITSPITITGLTGGSTYFIKLKAVNSIGVGSESSALSITIPSAPLAPTSLSYSTSGTSAIISFAAGSNGGSAITNYQYSTNGGTSFSAFNPAITSSPVTIIGLTNGSTYSVILKAVNVIGTGASSAALSVVIPAIAPSAPTDLSSSQISANSVNISFTAGSNGGSAITNYQYSTNGGTSFTAFNPTDNSSPVTITGLNGGTTYSILLKAVNSVGAGTASSAISVTTAKIAGSIQLNGSSNLILTNGVAVGGGAYTLETWFYNTASDWTMRSLLGGGPEGVTNCLSVFFSNGTTITTDLFGPGTQRSYTFAQSPSLNAWHHFVLVRNSTNVETVFIDGNRATGCAGGTAQSGGRQTNSLNYSGMSRNIGSQWNAQWTGYFANFRIVVGTAVYNPLSSPFTVPNAALTNISNTRYLMTGSSITNDGSSTQTVTTNGTVTLSTSNVPF